MNTKTPRITLTSLSAIALTVASTSAQSFNIDGGDPATAPSSAYGAAAMQPGLWNDFPANVIGQPVTGLLGAPTGVTVTNVALGDHSSDNAGTSGDDELLMDDFLCEPSVVTISGLNPDTYTVYTYAWAPDNAAFSTEVCVTNSPELPQVCGGAWPNGHMLGVTYTLHTVVVDAMNPNIEIFLVASFVFATLNGIQIVDSSGGGAGTTYCSPAIPNSTGLPGEISVMGSVVATDNNVTLTASNLPLNSFGFFLTSTTQGFVPNPGGSQGNLCLGGAIGRYVGPGQIKNAGATGVISLLLDLTQTPQPMGFVSVNAGETWNYQAWTRDSVGGMATSNFTNGLEFVYF